MKYRNLRAEIVRAGIDRTEFANRMGWAMKTFNNKMNGTTDFKYSEVKQIHAMFPECTIEYLFEEFQ